MKKTSRLGLILLALAIIGWFAVVRGQIDRFSEKSLEAKVVSEELASHELRIRDVEEIKQKGEAIQQNLRALFLAMPRTTQVPEVLVMIESIANSTGVVLSSAAVGTASAGEVPITVGFSGGVTEVTKFLDLVYNNIRTASVKSQIISSDAAGNLSVTMQLGLVYQGVTPQQ